MTCAQYGQHVQTSALIVRKWCRNGLIPCMRLPSGEYRIDPCVADAALTKGGEDGTENECAGSPARDSRARNNRPR